MDTELTEEASSDDPITRISQIAQLEPAGEPASEEDRPPRVRVEGLVIGEVISLDACEQPIVRFGIGRGQGGLIAGSLIPIDVNLVGKKVALQFMNGDPMRPIILGPIVHGLSEGVQSEQAMQSVQVDDGEITFAAERRLVLRCGDGSITLTREGKIIIRGSYVSNRSSGMLRLRGGTVSIN